MSSPTHSHRLAVLAMLVAAASASSAGALYGLSANAALIVISSNGTVRQLSDPQPYAQAQQLSCVDAQRSIFYFIGYDQATSTPNLIGLSLTTGATLTTTPLPSFYDGTYVGIGQYIAVQPSSPRVFVGGQDVSRNHIVGLVDPASGAFEVLANLTSSLRDVFGGTSVFVPATNELWFELDVDIMILDLATRAITAVIPVNASYEILGMNLDARSGLVYGLGGGPGQGVRTVVALDPQLRTITPVGAVPAYAMQMGGMTAYDPVARSVFWIGQETGGASDAPWFLVQVSVDGGRVLSAAPICVAGGVCPWSLHHT